MSAPPSNKNIIRDYADPTKQAGVTSAHRVMVDPGVAGLQQDSVASYSTITVNNIATLLIASNANRLCATIVNNGNIAFYLGFSGSVVPGVTAVADGGLLIQPNGGSWSSSQMAGYTGPMYGITNSGSTVVAVSEC